MTTERGSRQWAQLPEAWKAAFREAWESYRMGSIPIGAALADASGTVIAFGRSMQYEKSGPEGRIVWSKLSHAELNTLLQVSAHDYGNIRGCMLYTTVEPCPLCFGALVMSHVRSLCFAARDAWAGSTNLIQANGYIASKYIRVSGPLEELETVSIAINTEYFLRNSDAHSNTVVDAWEEDCPAGVRLGRELMQNGTLKAAADRGAEIGDVIESLLV